MRLWRFSTEFDVCDEFGKRKNVTDDWSSRTDMVWFAHWDVEATNYKRLLYLKVEKAFLYFMVQPVKIPPPTQA